MRSQKKIAALLGAVAGTAVLAPTSYADLLKPIPNAVEALKADDAAKTAQLQLAGWVWDGYSWHWEEPQYYYDPGYWGRRHHHHSHHHHHAHHHHHSWDGE